MNRERRQKKKTFRMRSIFHLEKKHEETIAFIYSVLSFMIPSRNIEMHVPEQRTEMRRRRKKGNRRDVRGPLPFFN